jgi:hypothetical protein
VEPPERSVGLVVVDARQRLPEDGLAATPSEPASLTWTLNWKESPGPLLPTNSALHGISAPEVVIVTIVGNYRIDRPTAGGRTGNTLHESL